MYVPVALIGVCAMSNIPPDETVYEESTFKHMLILPVLILGKIILPWNSHPQRINFPNYFKVLC